MLVLCHNIRLHADLPASPLLIVGYPRGYMCASLADIGGIASLKCILRAILDAGES